jgi:hypothetical protein
MANRTFKQLGQAYGSTPVSVVVYVDGTEVYSGTVPTVDQPVPALPDTNISLTSQLFTWEKAMSASGTSVLEVTVTGGTLVLADTLANYCKIWAPNTTPKTISSTGVDGWDELNDLTAGPPPPPYVDPFSNVTISGIAKTADHTNLPGQYYWSLQSGDTFSCTVSYVAGQE